MKDSLIFFPSGPDSTGYVGLSSTSTGRLVEKHILTEGEFYYPGAANGKVLVTPEFMSQIVENFEKKVCPIVQFPVVGKDNQHTEDPLRNLGEVVGLSRRNGRLYARIDVRSKHADAVGDTILGASAAFHPNYTDSRTGERVGPTLLHVVATNRPHLTDLEGFTDVIAATAADGTGEAVMLTATKKEDPMLLSEMLDALKSDHDIDVPALQEKAKQADSLVALSAAVQDALGGTDIITLSADDGALDVDGLAAAVRAAGEKIVTLSATIAEREEADVKAAASTRVDDLIAAGKILPRQREANVRLLLSNPEIFEALVPDAPLVNLSGSAIGDDDALSAPVDEVSAEIDRISSTYIATSGE